MPSPVLDRSYKPVYTLYQTALVDSNGSSRLYRQFRNRLAGNSFSVLFRAHIQEAISRNNFSSVFVVNLSGFGTVNENYGHDGGDQFLAKVEEHINQFFRAQGLNVAVSRSGINFVIVTKDLKNGAARKTLKDLHQYLSHKKRSYIVGVKAKYITRDGNVRAGVQSKFPAQNGMHTVDIRKAPLFDSRKRQKAGFPTFHIGLVEGAPGMTASSYQEAVEKVIGSVNIRSKDPLQPPVHVYQATDLAVPKEEVALFVTRGEIEAFQALVRAAKDTGAILGGQTSGEPTFETLSYWLNFDVGRGRTGAQTKSAFLSELEAIYAEKIPQTLASVDINGFGSFNATFNSDTCNLGTLLGDHAVKLLCEAMDVALKAADIKATVYRTGGDELNILSSAKPKKLGAALKKYLPQELAKRAADPNLDLTFSEEEVPVAIRAKLKAQGIYAEDGIYSINALAIARSSPKYQGKIFKGLSISLGVLGIRSFNHPAHELIKDTDGMAEVAKRKCGTVRIKYDQRTDSRERRKGKRAADGRRYINGG